MRVVMRVVMRSGAAVAGIACASLLGASWNVGPIGLAASPVILTLWRRAPTRKQAWCVVVSYYAGAAAPTLLGLVGRGYGDVSTAELAACVFGGAALMASVWSALWSSRLLDNSVSSSLRIALLLCLTALPGIGTVGVASPLTAAGLWLAGLGWWGLVIHTGALTVCTRDARTLLAWALLATASGVASSQAEALDTHGMLGRPTHLDVAALGDFAGQYRTAMGAQRAADAIPDDAEVVVLGEGLGGLWTSAMQSLWQAERTSARSATLIVGTTLPVYRAPGRLQYEAAAMILRPDGSVRSVRQRVPMPLVLWRPWREDGAYRAHWWEPGTAQAGGETVGVIICYEQLLVFPVLTSLAAGARVLIGLSNTRELGTEYVARWQQTSLRAWARLFGVPWVLATNS
ncbi:MAG: hypothetical protein JWN04_2597 [Myxococcaceae bacterium]|nr:hypothetical protein [Myxococcaceae bacterium]